MDDGEYFGVILGVFGSDFDLWLLSKGLWGGFRRCGVVSVIGSVGQVNIVWLLWIWENERC